VPIPDRCRTQATGSRSAGLNLTYLERIRSKLLQTEAYEFKQTSALEPKAAPVVRINVKLTLRQSDGGHVPIPDRCRTQATESRSAGLNSTHLERINSKLLQTEAYEFKQISAFEPKAAPVVRINIKT
jgi:hypothetical protein